MKLFKHSPNLTIQFERVGVGLLLDSKNDSRSAFDFVAFTHQQDMIEVPGVGDRPSTQLSRQTLAGFIQPRVEEIFQQVQEELQRSGKERLLRAGIVLTGGAAQMPGMTELGEEIFHTTVKLSMPHYDGNLRDYVRNPRYSTAMGLLQEGVAQRHRGMKVQSPKSFKQVLARMRTWFSRNF